MILLKIDVAKIDKSKLFRGAKGTYLDLVIMENRNGTDQYGNDYMVVQGVSKEERQAGVKGAILGNGKNVGGNRGGGGQRSSHPNDSDPSRSRYDPPPRSGPAKPASQENLDEDVPF